MVVRIRYERPQPNLSLRQFALTAAALLTPSALIAFTMAFWVIAAEMQWTGQFVWSHGLFSHWQVWVASAAVLLLVARLLEKLSASPS